MNRDREIPRRFWDDQDWGLKHYAELVKKFPEMWVAIIGKKVVAHGESPRKVRQKVREKIGVENIPVLFIESGVHVY